MLTQDFAPRTLSFAKRLWMPFVGGLLDYTLIRFTNDTPMHGGINWKRPVELYFVEGLFTIALFYGVSETMVQLQRFVYQRYSADLPKGAYLLRETTIVLSCMIVLFNSVGIPFMSLTDDGMSFYDLFVGNVYGIVFTCIFLLLTRGRDYIRLLNQSEMELQRYKQESASARYQALKSQLNPHFLFNALNTLAALVHKDAEAADDFIHSLAEVYRYVLDNAERDLVPLRTELAFISVYASLLQTRFKESFSLTVEVDESHTDWLLPPMTLQVLVENAVKHNIVSAKHPLAVVIRSTSNSEQAEIVVENTLQERSEKDPSSSVGLANLASRYGHLSDQKVLVERLPSLFRVTVPLLDE